MPLQTHRVIGHVRERPRRRSWRWLAGSWIEHRQWVDDVVWLARQQHLKHRRRRRRHRLHFRIRQRRVLRPEETSTLQTHLTDWTGPPWHCSWRSAAADEVRVGLQLEMAGVTLRPRALLRLHLRFASAAAFAASANARQQVSLGLWCLQVRHRAVILSAFAKHCRAAPSLREYVPRTPSVSMRREATDFSYHSSAARAAARALDVLASTPATGVDATAEPADGASCKEGAVAGAAFETGYCCATTGLGVRRGALPSVVLVGSVADERSSCLHSSGDRPSSCSGVCNKFSQGHAPRRSNNTAGTLVGVVRIEGRGLNTVAVQRQTLD